MERHISANRDPDESNSPGQKIEVLRIEIAKLELSKGDTLVLKMPHQYLKEKIQKRMIDTIKKIWKGKFLILPKDINIEVISEEKTK